MSLSKKLRFKIFTRDGFTCQYCGRNPIDHEVVLEVDHSLSKKDKGTNDEDNLVTSCFDCNRGKSKSSIILSKKIDIKQKLKNAKDQLEQVKGMSKLVKLKREIDSSKLEWVDDFVGCYSESLQVKMKKIVKKELGYGTEISVLQECMEITFDKFCDQDNFYTNDFAKYFYGVLRNRKPPNPF